MLRSRLNAEQVDQLDEILEPPNRINPATGLPYSWGADDDDDLQDLPLVGG